MLLAWLSAGFQSLSQLWTNKLGISGADSLVGGFVYVPGPCGSLQCTLLWDWRFLLPLQLPLVFTARGFEAFFSHAGTLDCVVCLTPHLFFLDYLHADMGPPSPPAATFLWIFSAHAADLYPSHQSE